MAVRIYHKDHGYVITADQDQIDMLLAKGGIIDEPKKEEPKLEPIVTKPLTAKRHGTRKL